MKKVFVGGSRRISRLNDIPQQHLEILVNDLIKSLPQHTEPTKLCKRTWTKAGIEMSRCIVRRATAVTT